MCNETLFTFGKISAYTWRVSHPGPLNQRTSLTLLTYRSSLSRSPAGTSRKNEIVLTSMQRDDIASTSIRYHFGTKCPLGGVSLAQHLKTEYTPLLETGFPYAGRPIGDSKPAYIQNGPWCPFICVMKQLYICK